MQGVAITKSIELLGPKAVISLLFYLETPKMASTYRTRQ